MYHGRPSKAVQIRIQEKLRECFEYGLTATFAAERTGVNIKTVCKYFDEWTEQITEQQNLDYFERQRLERERIIISLDRQIANGIDSLKEIDGEIKKYGSKTIPRHLFSHRLEVHKFISNLIERKGVFALQPPVDEALRQKISEMLREHVTKSSS